jgi:hypothetical protein
MLGERVRNWCCVITQNVQSTQHWVRETYQMVIRRRSFRTIEYSTNVVWVVVDGYWVVGKRSQVLVAQKNAKCGLVCGHLPRSDGYGGRDDKYESEIEVEVLG